MASLTPSQEAGITPTTAGRGGSTSWRHRHPQCYLSTSYDQLCIAQPELWFIFYSISLALWNSARKILIPETRGPDGVQAKDKKTQILGSALPFPAKWLCLGILPSGKFTGEGWFGKISTWTWYQMNFTFLPILLSQDYLHYRLGDLWLRFCGKHLASCKSASPIISTTWSPKVCSGDAH